MGVPMQPSGPGHLVQVVKVGEPSQANVVVRHFPGYDGRMDFGIAGKVAMVAAGTKGIGLAVAKELAQEGCRVSLCGRDPGKFAEALEDVGHGAKAYVCDVTDAASLDAWHRDTVADLGEVDILVTNTGGPPAGTWTDMTDDQWLEGVSGTLLNVVRQVRTVCPAMCDRGWGRVVHITSLVAKEPNSLLAISSTLRSGLVSLTRLQSDTLAPSGVTVNCVLPGHTLTDRQIHLAEIMAARDGITTTEALTKRGQSVPVGRIGKPEEIASAVAYLCSARASFVTGTSLLVDGGAVRGPG